MTTLLSDWFTTISLVFGGCCSNAITLKQLTSEYPQAGSLITFFQFLIISIHGLPKHTTWTRYGPRLKPRRIPLTPYLIQVALFYFISLLNNAAFAYRIPMAVHIIFRSAGLVISMLLGWLVVGKRYTLTQIISVLLVTFGVILTTLSASEPRKTSKSPDPSANPYTYATGIAILTLALVLSGFLGLVQDWTYSKYGRPTLPSTSDKTSGSQEKQKTKESSASQESMFYLHFLGLPMFYSVRSDLMTQIKAVNAGPHLYLSIPTLFALPTPPPFIASFLPHNSSIFAVSTPTAPLASSTLRFAIPSGYFPLLLNTFTQLFCVAGVHRLITRVTTLTVTLVLVVRKAVSLVLSVVGVGMMGHGKGSGAEVDKVMMWTGAAMVLIGTITYSVGSGKGSAKEKNKKE